MSQSLQKFLPPKKKATVNYTEGDAASESQTAAASCDTLASHKSASSTADLSPEVSSEPAAAQIPSCSSVEVHSEPSGDDVSQEPAQGSCPPADIGDIFVRAKSSADFCISVRGLTIAQKYELMKNHRKPGTNHVFPTQYLGGCNRSFRQVWLTEHLWMVYSELVDGAFCIACAIFSAHPLGDKFVIQPFRVWNKKSEKVKEHERCLYHQSAMEQADQLRRTVEQPHTSIAAQVDASKAANIQRNRAVLKSIARAVLFCGRQCIALRGDVEKLAMNDTSVSGSPGNFLALLKLLAVHDDILHSHLEAPTMRCVTYISPRTQNELIKVMGKHMILRGILDDLNVAPYYFILAHEVTSHNVEHLAICARFVDKNKNIREEFLSFLEF